MPMDKHNISEIVEFLKSKLGDFRPDIAIVCGSGLSGLSANILNPIAIPYEDIPHFPRSSVAGHGTELVFGELGGKKVVAQRGRFHMYEGYEPSQVTIPVRVFAALGARIVIVTNAAGGVNPDFSVGDVMIIKDHISFPSLSGLNALSGSNDDRFGPRFPPLTTAYTPELQEVAAESFTALGFESFMRSGTYFHDSGPSYETPAEVKFIRQAGGDSVGMSTAPEVIAAAHTGLAVLGLSLITNVCRVPGDTGVPPSHEEVLEATEKRAIDMQSLVAEVIKRIAINKFPQSKAVETVKAPAAKESTPEVVKPCPVTGCTRSAPKCGFLHKFLPVAAFGLLSGAAGAAVAVALIKAKKL